ncbi:UDP-glucose 4-epimerase GalE [Mycolicibacterium chubuense]|uniref:UDP-glucose 4-epimerase n=1 Tax=Mycolicibacterium chubuense TaxID=1800 RepID=A0A0J6WSM1_MYCCU|nr:UDP-glucose 4-epimerase GalE [Mycolicibacterium chubuense]KMO84782.1 UDP-glucose 4-epimerase [Mycolicibacterium chubuense]ORA47957.1 UDP-glucose 4-epimerase GalE [Mycolicibacterium chubuense]SPX95191.1 UDP-glucose-4-epimerase [Mycolicibacterium chubuense]
MRIMVTGGAGYIGAHVVLALRRDGHDVAVIDDLSTGAPDRLTDDTPLFVCSVLDTEQVAENLRAHGCELVVHVAAKKAVEQSVAEPLMYYRENVIGMHSVLTAMVQAGVGKILFSSSAAVYGAPTGDLVGEQAVTAPASPYGWTKLMCEQMIRDVAAATALDWVALRYFNVAGAADPDLADRGENNLIPRVFRAICSGVPPQIFGDEYPTRDGTCIRDYIHVADVADAHAAAVRGMSAGAPSAIYNIGTGSGTSVLEVMHTARRITGLDFDWDVRPPRAGDSPAVIADAAKIRAGLGWQSRYDLDDIIGSAWQSWSNRSEMPIAR